MDVAVVIEGRLPAAFGIARSGLRSAAAFFASRSRGRIGNPRWHEVVVHLVDDAGSDELYGELFVNVDQAFRAAPKRKGWSAKKELLLYVAHGMDHLSGADDHEERDYLVMRRRELRWIGMLPV